MKLVNEKKLIELQHDIEQVCAPIGNYLSLSLIAIDSVDTPYNQVMLDKQCKKMLATGLLHSESKVHHLGSGLFALIYCGIDCIDGPNWLNQSKIQQLQHLYGKNVVIGMGCSSLRGTGVTQSTLMYHASSALECTDMGEANYYLKQPKRSLAA